MGKLDITKAFDTTDFGCCRAGIVGEHRRRVIELKTPGCSTRHRARNHMDFQGSAPHQKPHFHLDNEALSLGAIAPHRRTARLGGGGQWRALDAIELGGRQAAYREHPRDMKDMWHETVQLIELAKFSVDESDGQRSGPCGTKRVPEAWTT